MAGISIFALAASVALEIPVGGYSSEVKVGKGYTLFVPILNVSPDPLPADPDGGDRQIREGFAAVKENARQELAQAASFYEPWVEDFLHGKHRFSRWRHLVSPGPHVAAGRQEWPLDLLCSAELPGAHLTFDFEPHTPDLVRVIVSMQFLAAVGADRGGFARWPASRAFTNEMDLAARIDRLLPFSNMDSLRYPVDHQFLVDAFHSPALLSTSISTPVPPAPPGQGSAGRDEKAALLERTLVRRGHLLIVTGYLSRCADPQSRVDVHAILTLLRRIDTLPGREHVALTDVLVALLLALTDDDLWSAHAAEIKEAIRGLGAERRKLWFSDEGRIDWSKIPTGASLQIGGENPARTLEAVNKALF